MAGKQLSFKGEVVETHEATVEEMAKWASMMSAKVAVVVVAAIATEIAVTVAATVARIAAIVANNY